MKRTRRYPGRARRRRLIRHRLRERILMMGEDARRGHRRMPLAAMGWMLDMAVLLKYAKDEDQMWEMLAFVGDTLKKEQAGINEGIRTVRLLTAYVKKNGWQL